MRMVSAQAPELLHRVAVPEGGVERGVERRDRVLLVQRAAGAEGLAHQLDMSDARLFLQQVEVPIEQINVIGDSRRDE